jgi:hypothetical protein
MHLPFEPIRQYETSTSILLPSRLVGIFFSVCARIQQGKSTRKVAQMASGATDAEYQFGEMRLDSLGWSDTGKPAVSLWLKNPFESQN